MFDKSKIGYSFPPFTIEVERGKIRELALAIGDDNPIYQSREAAQAADTKIDPGEQKLQVNLAMVFELQ